ncbi:hypothetical protein BGW38_002303, partial [Lunasporangiospora selenospora]
MPSSATATTSTPSQSNSTKPTASPAPESAPGDALLDLPFDSTSSKAVITPEDDLYPSWVFFPSSATYIPPSVQPTYSSSASASAATASFPSAGPASPSTPSVANGVPTNNNNASSTPSTHHRILDHCFYLSIETRLKQAEAQYLASTQEQAIEQQRQQQQQDKEQTLTQENSSSSATKQDRDWKRRQRTLVDEAVVLGRKGSNVEAIVD